MKTDGACDPAEAVTGYLQAARSAIDATFGDGHAAAHPELVAAYLQACTVEAAVLAGRKTAEEALQAAARISRETNETLLRLKPRIFG